MREQVCWICRLAGPQRHRWEGWTSRAHNVGPRAMACLRRRTVRMTRREASRPSPLSDYRAGGGNEGASGSAASHLARLKSAVRGHQCRDCVAGHEARPSMCVGRVTPSALRRNKGGGKRPFDDGPSAASGVWGGRARLVEMTPGAEPLQRCVGRTVKRRDDRPECRLVAMPLLAPTEAVSEWLRSSVASRMGSPAQVRILSASWRFFLGRHLSPATGFNPPPRFVPTGAPQTRSNPPRESARTRQVGLGGANEFWALHQPRSSYLPMGAEIAKASRWANPLRQAYAPSTTRLLIPLSRLTTGKRGGGEARGGGWSALRGSEGGGWRRRSASGGWHAAWG